MADLMANGKKVIGWALGNNMFLNSSSDNKIYRASNPITLSKGGIGNLKVLWVETNQALVGSTGSTIQDLINKKIPLTAIVILSTNSDINVMVSEPIDITAVDPNDPIGHKFSWITNDDSTNTRLNIGTVYDGSKVLSRNAFTIESNTLSNIIDNFSDYDLVITYPFKEKISGSQLFTMSFSTRNPNTEQWLSDFTLNEASIVTKYYLTIDGQQTQTYTGSPLSGGTFDKYKWGSDGTNFYVDNGSRSSAPSVTITYWE